MALAYHCVARGQSSVVIACSGNWVRGQVLACRNLAERAGAQVMGEGMIGQVDSAIGSNCLRGPARTHAVLASSKREQLQRAKGLKDWYSCPLAISDSVAPKLQVRIEVDTKAYIQGTKVPFEGLYRSNRIEGSRELRSRIACGYVANQLQQDLQLVELDCFVAVRPIVTSKHPAEPEGIGTVDTDDHASCSLQRSSQLDSHHQQVDFGRSLHAGC